MFGYFECVNCDCDVWFGVCVMKFGFDYLSLFVLIDIGMLVIEWLCDVIGFVSYLVVCDGCDVVFVVKVWMYDLVMSVIKVNIGMCIFVYVLVYGYVLFGDFDQVEFDVLFLELMLLIYMLYMLCIVMEVYVCVQKYVVDGYVFSELLFEFGILVISVLVCDSSGLIVVVVMLIVVWLFFEKLMIDQGFVGQVWQVVVDLLVWFNYYVVEYGVDYD